MIVFDLDDTLYPEREFVKSAYRAIDNHLHKLFGDSTPDCYNTLWNAFENGINPFDCLLDRFCPWSDPETGVKELLQIYRYHTPDIKLTAEAEDVLRKLHAAGLQMAIITDGRATTQRAKIVALDLYRYIKPEDVLISEETGFDKHSDNNFRLLMQRYPTEDKMIYVGDNPAKDFFHPNRLGWTTMMLIDNNSKNIHRQNAETNPEKQAQIAINSLSELIELM